MSANVPAQKPAPLWRMPAMLLLAGYTLGGFTGFFVTMASLPVWLTQSGTSDSLAGQVTTVLLIATVSTQMLVPRMVQGIGLGATLALGLLTLGAPSLGFLVSNDLVWVMVLCAIRGFGFGILTVLGSLLTARLVPVERRGEAVGIYGLAIAVPNLLAIPGGVALVSAHHFPAVALVGAAPLLGLPIVAALSRYVNATPDKSTDATQTSTPVGRISRRRARNAAIAPAAVLMVVTLSSGGFLTYLPIELPHGSVATVALLIWGVTGALSRWRVGLMADRSGLGVLLPTSSGLAITGMGMVTIGLMVSTPGVGTTLLFVGAAVLGMGYGAVQNLTLVAAFARARQQEAATVSAIWNVGFDAGTALGAGLVGAMITAISVPAALGTTAAIVALSIPLAIMSARPPKPLP